MLSQVTDKCAGPRNQTCKLPISSLVIWDIVLIFQSIILQRYITSCSHLQAEFTSCCLHIAESRFSHDMVHTEQVSTLNTMVYIVHVIYKSEGPHVFGFFNL